MSWLIFFVDIKTDDNQSDTKKNQETIQKRKDCLWTCLSHDDDDDDDRIEPLKIFSAK